MPKFLLQIEAKLKQKIRRVLKDHIVKAKLASKEQVAWEEF